MKVIYPGTFDPITNGHVSLIRRALKLFDFVIVAVSTGNKKNYFFSENTRVLQIKKVLFLFKGVYVVKLRGLLSSFIREVNVSVVIRGIRNFKDFEYEFEMTVLNGYLNNNIETVFFFASDPHRYLSSTVVKEIARIDVLKIKQFVDPIIYKYFTEINK